jgi:hypothetical protein
MSLEEIYDKLSAADTDVLASASRGPAADSDVLASSGPAADSDVRGSTYKFFIFTKIYAFSNCWVQQGLQRPPESEGVEKVDLETINTWKDFTLCMSSQGCPDTVWDLFGLASPISELAYLVQQGSPWTEKIS